MREEKKMGQVISIDDKMIKDHLDELARGTVEESLIEMCLTGVSARRVAQSAFYRRVSIFIPGRNRAQA